MSDPKVFIAGRQSEGLYPETCSLKSKREDYICEGDRFVRWEDYARLKAEVERLTQEYSDATNHYNKLFNDSQAEVERLRKAGEWQPIETAPKDETAVLIYYQISDHVDNNGNTYVGRWYDDMEAGDPLFSVIGIGLLTPTHWMPLPNPPAAKDGKPTA